MAERRVRPRIVLDEPGAEHRAKARSDFVDAIVDATRRGKLDRDVVLAALDGPKAVTVPHRCGPVTFQPRQDRTVCPRCGNGIYRD